jgi:hypothetical protein
MAQEVSNRILPVLKTAAPDPTIFEEPTIFKSSKSLDTSSTGFWIKMLFLLLFISLLGLNVYYYLTEGVTLMTKFFGDGLENTEENIEKGVGTVEKALEEKKRQDDYNPSELEKTLDEPRKKDEPTPSPDLSNESDIQLAKKAGYCYVGTLNKKRTCIEIDEDDKCMSGDIFPTRDICMNPNLRN